MKALKNPPAIDETITARVIWGKNGIDNAVLHVGDEFVWHKQKCRLYGFDDDNNIVLQIFNNDKYAVVTAYDIFHEVNIQLNLPNEIYVAILERGTNSPVIREEIWKKNVDDFGHVYWGERKFNITGPIHRVDNKNGVMLMASFDVRDVIVFKQGFESGIGWLGRHPMIKQLFNHGSVFSNCAWSIDHLVNTQTWGQTPEMEIEEDDE